MADSAARFRPWGRHIVVVAWAVASAAAGCAALAGWYFGIPVLNRLDARFIPMAPSTALLLLLFGGTLAASFLVPGRRWLLRLRRGIAVFGSIASLALLILSSLKISFALEHLGLTIPPGAGDFPLGHMSPATALCLLLAGLSLTAAPDDPDQGATSSPWSLLPAGMLVAASGTMILAYIFGTPVLYSGTFIPPAATTLAAVFALGISEAGTSWPRRGKDLAPDRAGRRDAGLLILAFLGLSGGIIGAGVFSYRQFEQHHRAEVERQLAAVADLKVAELVRWRAERLADAASFFHNPAFATLAWRALAAPGDADALRLLQGWLETHQRHEDYSRIALLDADGVERLAAPAAATTPDPGMSHDFKAALQTREIAFLDIHRHASGEGTHLGLVVPILEPGADRPLGVLLMSMDPASRLYPALQHWPTPSRSAETLLVRREGNEAVFLNELRFRKDAALMLRIPLERQDVPAVAAVLGHSGPLVGNDYRGARVVAFTRPVPGSPWFLVARMDLAEVYAPLRERLWLTVALLAALLLGAAVGMSLLWRQRMLGFYRERLAADGERAWLRTVIARSLNEIYTCDAATLRFTFANDGACRNLGYTADELLGLTPLDINPRFDAVTFAELVRPLRDGTIPVLTFASSHRRKDGSEYPVDVHLQLVESGRGKVLLAVISDISERRRAEETIARLNAGLELRVAERTVQLEAAVHELETFAYSVSHDLRAPLRAIEGFATMLAQDHAAALDTEGHRLLTVVRANARRMDALISDLLNLSRLTRSEMHSARVDVAALAGEVFREVASPQERRTVSFSADGIPDAWADPNLVRQVLSNLIANALKYSRPKPQRRIAVTGRNEGAMAVYTVSDTGVGFDQAFVHKLFGAFERLHRADEFEGAGIGLAIVKRIVQRHGGQVLAKGTPGEGAAFTFSLPALRDQV